MESDDFVYAAGGASRRAQMGLYDQLVQDGYCRLGGVLEIDMLDRLRTVTDRLLDEQSHDQHAAQRSTGSMISVTDDALFHPFSKARTRFVTPSIGCIFALVRAACHLLRHALRKERRTF